MKLGSLATLFLCENIDVKVVIQKNIVVKKALNFIAIPPRMFRIHPHNNKL
jgi:hypothetical protein